MLSRIRYKSLSRNYASSRFSLLLLVIIIDLFPLSPCWAQVATPCGIDAYPNTLVPTGQSMIDPMYGPIILFNPVFFQSLGIYGTPMYRYMLAHECAHHMNGDIIAQNMNPQGMFMINPQVELVADCSAAKYLKSNGDFGAVNAAITYWAQFGNNPTGLNYPTGDQRVQALQSCQ